MYIRELSVRNFLIHQDTTIRPAPLTVLVGPNGGGKSAIFDAMLNFSMTSRGNVRQAFGPYPFSYRATIYRGASNVSRIGFRVQMSRNRTDTDWLTYEIDYAQQPGAEDQPRFLIFHERLTKSPNSTVIFDRANPDAYPITSAVRLEEDRSIFSAIRLANFSATGAAQVDPLVEYCARGISRFNKFRLDPLILAQPNRLPEIGSESDAPLPPRLGYHGEELAATLYYLAETNDRAMDSIREKVKEADPCFQDFDFNSVGTDRIAFSANYSDSRGTVPSVRLSSGNLIYIGLITLVSTANRPPVLMIEEPENGLTPQAVKLFYEAVRRLAFSENPDDRSQVLISSHSPFVICEAWNGEDRDFIHQVKVENGKGCVRTFQEVIDHHGIQIGKDASGTRSILSLKNAENIMSGYMQ